MDIVAVRGLGDNCGVCDEAAVVVGSGVGGSVGNWLGGRETREGALLGVEMAESFFVTCASSPWCMVVLPYLPPPPAAYYSTLSSDTVSAISIYGFLP